MHHNKEYLEAINEMLLDEAKKKVEDKQKEAEKKKAEADKKKEAAKKAEDKKTDKKKTTKKSDSKKIDSKKSDKINEPYEVKKVPGEANTLPPSYAGKGDQIDPKYKNELDVADTEPKQADIEELGTPANLDNPIKQTPRTDKRDTNTDHADAVK